jgi:hypothetical protein
MRRDMAALGIDPAKVAVHYTGIDTARFHPGDRKAAKAALGMGDAPAILSVGALIARKGQALVIDALPMLPGAHYWLAGAGEEEGRYRAQAERIGVADRVHFPGSVANADLPQLYRAADVVVMPSASRGSPMRGSRRLPAARPSSSATPEAPPNSSRHRMPAGSSSGRQRPLPPPCARSLPTRPRKAMWPPASTAGSIGTETAASLRTISTAALAGRRTDSGVSRKSYTTAPSSLRSMRSAPAEAALVRGTSCQGQPSAIRGSARPYRSTNRCR